VKYFEDHILFLLYQGLREMTTLMTTEFIEDINPIMRIVNYFSGREDKVQKWEAVSSKLQSQQMEEDSLKSEYVYLQSLCFIHNTYTLSHSTSPFLI
jgi:hypothetical protein